VRRRAAGRRLRGRGRARARRARHALGWRDRRARRRVARGLRPAEPLAAGGGAAAARRQHRLPRAGGEGAMILGLLPAIRGGIGELAQTGQHTRLIDGYLAPYACAFGDVRYFSYLDESLAAFTD